MRTRRRLRPGRRPGPVRRRPPEAAVLPAAGPELRAAQRRRPLPGPTQWAPLYGLLADDVDRDGYLDLLAVGNSYAADVVTGRHDALVGLVLRGDGRGQFEAVPHQESGFFVDGNARALVRLHGPGGAVRYIASQNNDVTRVFAPATERSVETADTGPLDAYALITFADSTRQRHELYYDGGYLSQSSRTLPVPPGAVRVTLHRYDE